MLGMQELENLKRESANKSLAELHQRLIDEQNSYKNIQEAAIRFQQDYDDHLKQCETIEKDISLLIIQKSDIESQPTSTHWLYGFSLSAGLSLVIGLSAFFMGAMIAIPLVFAGLTFVSLLAAFFNITDSSEHQNAETIQIKIDDKSNQLAQKKQYIQKYFIEDQSIYMQLEKQKYYVAFAKLAYEDKVESERKRKKDKVPAQNSVSSTNQPDNFFSHNSKVGDYTSYFKSFFGV